MEKRAEILYDAARRASYIDMDKLNPNYESLVTHVLKHLEGDFDYNAYVTACRMATGHDPCSGASKKTCLLYETVGMAQEGQIEILTRAAGIVAHKDFSW